MSCRAFTTAIFSCLCTKPVPSDHTHIYIPYILYYQSICLSFGWRDVAPVNTPFLYLGHSSLTLGNIVSFYFSFYNFNVSILFNLQYLFLSRQLANQIFQTSELTFLILTCWRQLSNCCSSLQRSIISSSLILFSSRCLCSIENHQIKQYHINVKYVFMGYVVRIVWSPLDYLCHLISGTHIIVFWGKFLPNFPPRSI